MYKLHVFIIILLFWSFTGCKNEITEKLNAYEEFVKSLELKQINKETLDIDSITQKRDSIIMNLKNHKLNRSQMEWLNALNSRFEIVIMNERNKFPTDTIPEYMQKLLELPDGNINNITPKNLRETFSKFLAIVKDSTIHRDSLLKVYKFLERYLILYTDKIDDTTRIEIEKIMIDIERYIQ